MNNNNIVVIIPRGFRKTLMFEFSHIKYFIPKIINIQNEQTIKWINKDSICHHLVSGNVEEGKTDGILNTGIIESGNSFSKTFDSSKGLINYYCVLHPAERGAIMIYDNQLKDKKSVDNQFRYFRKGLENVRRTSLESILKRYVDPVVLESFDHPNSNIVRNKVLTIVFWDITGFSRLCIILKNEPYMIIGFLHEFFNEANHIIHRHNGILDKFIGDGIMAIYGYKNKDYYDNTGSSSKESILSAIELSKSFTKIRNEWIRIWKDQFNLDIINDLYLKCGIDTGETLVGRITTDSRDQFTVFGSTVNLASRLQERAEKNQIIISEYTKGKIDKEFQTKEIKIKENDRIKSFEYIDRYYELLIT